MKITLLLMFVLFCFFGQDVSAQEAIAGMEKTVQSSVNELFRAKVVDVKANTQLNFQLIVTNFSTEAIPSLRLVDVFPQGLVFIKGNLPPERVEVVNNTTSMLWVLRAMQPKETRIINYSASLLVDEKKDPTCLYNVSSLINNGKLTDTSSTEICPLSNNPQILGTMTNHPNTAISDWGMLEYALIAFIIGTFGFTVSNLLSKKRFIYM